MSGAHPAKVYADEPLDFRVTSYLPPDGRGSVRVGATRDSHGWHETRAYISQQLADPAIQSVRVADARDKRVTLATYWPGDDVPLGGPDPAPAHPALAILADCYTGWGETAHRRALARLRSHLK